MDAPFHPDIGFLAQRRRGLLRNPHKAQAQARRLSLLADLQAAINRFLEEHNQLSKAFTWTADPDKIIAAVRRGLAMGTACSDASVHGASRGFGGRSSRRCPMIRTLNISSSIPPTCGHQHAAAVKKGSEDQALRRLRGGPSTKIHMAVRGLGCPVRVTLAAGQKAYAPSAAKE
jgi:hypothetical protein